MILTFTADGNLPPGIHEVSLQEFINEFGKTAYRQILINGFLGAIAALKIAGCKRVYVDGSFVTTKLVPGDYDACWDMNGVDPNLLDPVFFDFNNGRLAQKIKYFGEFFPSQIIEGGSGLTFLEFFQVDKNTGASKGIVAINL